MKRFLRKLLLGAAVTTAALFAVTGLNYNGDTAPVVEVRQELQVTAPLSSGAWLQTICDDELTDVTGNVAQVIIRAQDKAEVGELIRFDLTGSTAQSFKWIMAPATVDFETYEAGKRAVFSARQPGFYTFTIACAYDGTVDVITHVVEVTSPKAPRGTFPQVAVPTASATIGQWTTYWCAANKRPKEEALRLAESFKNVASQISAGVLEDTNDIIAATAVANRAAVGDSLEAWMPVLQEFQTIMRQKADDGELSSPAQHKELWLEIARGMEIYGSLFN